MFEELLVKIAKGLQKEGLSYMIIGGQAVLVYGLARLTEDIDITLGVDVDMLPKILQLCKDIGLKRVKAANDEFVKKTNVLVCEDMVTGIRVDFIFSFLDYERQAIERARKIEIKGFKVKFASLEDLIIHKMFAGRARDLEDVGALLSKTKDTMAIDYIKRWLAEFARMSEFTDILDKFRQLEMKVLQTGKTEDEG